MAATTSRQSREFSSTFLVDRGDPRATPPLGGAAAGGLEGGAGDAVDLPGRALAGRHARHRRAPNRRADAAGELADDEQVGADDPLLAQRAGADQGRAGLYWAQVGEEAHPLAQAEQALLRARGVGIRRVPFGSADRAQQDRVGIAAGREGLVREGGAVLVDRAAAHQPLVELELAERLEQGACGADDLRADPVAGQDDYAGRRSRPGTPC